MKSRTHWNMEFTIRTSENKRDCLKPAWLLITLVIELKRVCIWWRGLWDLDPCPSLRLTKLCPQYQAIKCRYLMIFWIKKFKFLKAEKQNLCDFFCVYIIELQSYDLTVYVALELCSRFHQTWIFFWIFLKGIY